MFDLKGSFIIGSNTTFDTDIDAGIISLKSIQGQFTKKYYNNINHLDQDIATELNKVEYKILTDSRTGKTKKYPIGTVVKISLKNQITYFVAIADINEHGAASGNLDNLKTALAKLWEFKSNRGDLEPLIIPLLGTGFTKLASSREEILRVIVQSFIAANNEKKLTDKLTIVISAKDYSDFRLDLQGIDLYVSHLCKYTEFKNKSDTGGGQPVP